MHRRKKLEIRDSRNLLEDGKEDPAVEGKREHSLNL